MAVGFRCVDIVAREDLFDLWRGDGGWAGVKRDKKARAKPGLSLGRWAGCAVIVLSYSRPLFNVEADIHVVEGDPHKVDNTTAKLGVVLEMKEGGGGQLPSLSGSTAEGHQGRNVPLMSRWLGSQAPGKDAGGEGSRQIIWLRVRRRWRM